MTRRIPVVIFIFIYYLLLFTQNMSYINSPLSRTVDTFNDGSRTSAINATQRPMPSAECDFIKVLFIYLLKYDYLFYCNIIINCNPHHP
jgi:hypothetical protein